MPATNTQSATEKYKQDDVEALKQEVLIIRWGEMKIKIYYFCIMPTVLNIEGFRFHFFSDERNEPCHIHVKKGGARGKIWLVPEYDEEYFYDFTVKERKKIKEIVQQHQEFIIEKWNEYFGKSN